MGTNSTLIECRQVKLMIIVNCVIRDQCRPHFLVKLQNTLPSSEKSLVEFTNIPAVRSVTEFGYNEKLVKEAYETLQKAGKSGVYCY